MPNNQKNNQKNQEFIIEAEDIIQGLSKNLHQLQALSTSSIDISPDIIDALFRGMHSLKGISSISGFTKIAALSHKLEDMLDNLRFNRVKLTTRIVDTLFEGIDVLIRLLTSINDKGGEFFEIDYIVDKIGETLKEETASGEPPIGEVAYVNPDLLNRLSDYEVHRLMENLKHGASLYRITASFSAGTFDEDIARLQEKLTRFGEVIAFIATSGLSAGKGIIFEIIFASKEAKIEDCISDIIEGNIIDIKDIESIYTPKQRQTLANNKTSESSSKSITMAVRVCVEKLDTLLNNIGEIFLLNDTLFHATKDLKTQYGNNSRILEANKVSKELFKRLSLLRDDLIEIRMVPIGFMFDRLSRIVDKLCKELSKEIKMEVYGDDTKLDKSMIEGLADPLMHIIRNAADHGIEDEDTRLAAGKTKTGTISLRAFQRDSRILIEVEDDGHGIDFKKIRTVALEKGFINKEEEPDERRLIEFLFQSGFSTSNTINEISGRGVGLDVAARNIASLGGMVDVETKSGKGTKFSITLPLTLLIAKALIVRESDRTFAIPFNSISENFILRGSDIKRVGRREVLNIRGHFIPLVRLQDILRFTDETKNNVFYGKGEKRYVIVVGLAEKRAGIVVDAIKGQREILIKPLSELLGTVPGVSGFTEIDQKRILPVLDVGAIIEKCKV